VGPCTKVVSPAQTPGESIVGCGLGQGSGPVRSDAEQSDYRVSVPLSRLVASGPEF